MKKLITFCAIALCATLISAQNFDTLQNIKVTPNRIPETINNSGRSVTVISAKDIEESPATTLDELLRVTAGINLNNRGAFGVQSDIGIRGSTFSQVLIMVDNMRLNDPLTGHYNHILPIALGEIASIEIIRGPAAVAYGSDAVGGMIHIKTKSYKWPSLIDSTQLNADVAYGENNLLNTDISLMHFGKRWHIGASNKLLVSDGERFNNPSFPAVSSAPERFDTDFKMQTFSINGGYRLKDGTKITGRYGFDTRDFNAKFFYTGNPFDESRENIQTHWAQVNIKKDIFKRKDLTNLSPQNNPDFLNRSFEINLGYRNTQDTFAFNPLFAPNIHEMQKWAVNLNKNYQTSRSFNLAFGAQGELRQIQSTDRGNHEEIDAGLYLIAQKSFKDKVYATFSQRLAYHTNFNFAYLPQLSISVPHKKWNFKGSVGKSIRAADFTERFVSFNIPNLTPGRNAGNPDLQEEISWAGDLSAALKINSNHRFEFTAFARTSINLIDYTLTNSNEINNLPNLQPNQEYLYSQNFQSAETQGIEISYFVAKRIKQFKLNGNLNYTYLATQSSGGVPSKYISNHPTNNIGGQVVLGYRKFSVTIQGNYINRNGEVLPLINGEVPNEYVLLNPKVSFNAKENLTLYIQANNALDQQYQEILGAPMPGRWIFGGVRFKL